MLKFLKQIFYILLLVGIICLGWCYLVKIGKSEIFYSSRIVKTFVIVLKNNFSSNKTYGDRLLGEGEDISAKQNKQSEFSGTSDTLITLINKERFDHDLKPLKKNNLLMLSAKEKAEDMVRNNYFEHIAREGIQPWFFVERTGYRYETFGENIAKDYFSANSVHKAFMDSTGHRANILNKDFRDVGVAILPIIISDKRQFIVVEHFGSYLKDVNLEKAKCGQKNKQRCKVQKKKKKELLKMLKSQRDAMEQSVDGTGNDSPSKTISKKRLQETLQDLNNIKKDIDDYLNVCQELKNSCL